MRIAILRIGTVDKAVTRSVQDGLREIFTTAVCVILEEVMPIPKGAYSSSRRQYNSSRILARMSDFV